MIHALSYIIAVLISIALAAVLYPVAAFFWILGLFGKVSDVMFQFTTNVIKSIWKDLNSGSKE